MGIETPDLQWLRDHELRESKFELQRKLTKDEMLEFLVRNGYATANEVRKSMGLKPLEGKSDA